MPLLSPAPFDRHASRVHRDVTERIRIVRRKADAAALVLRSHTSLCAPRCVRIARAFHNF
jgi:hypothetical protein